jgi:hypothetical protein
LKSFNKTFNFVLSTSSFPSSWANGFIVLIYKGGPKDVQNKTCVGRL